MSLKIYLVLITLKNMNNKSHPLQDTLLLLNQAKVACVGEIIDQYGKCDETVDQAWRAIDRLEKRLISKKFKPYSK